MITFVKFESLKSILCEQRHASDLAWIEQSKPDLPIIFWFDDLYKITYESILSQIKTY